MGGLCESLRRAIESHGGEVGLERGVDEVLLDSARRKIRGVRVGRDEIVARIVVSTLDVRRLFTQLIPEPVLDARLQRRVDAVHTRCPSLFKVDVALDGLPSMPHPGAVDGLTANINLAPSLAYVERAWRSYERDEVGEETPVMCALPSILDPSLAPAGKHTLWLSCFNPVERWRRADHAEVQAAADRMVETFAEYAPGTLDLVLDRAITTPVDRERDTGNTGGNPFHLDMTVDQSMGLRPVVGLHRYRTPIEGLYLSGSGTHPGGGVTGIPGLNAANAVLSRRDLPGHPATLPAKLRVRGVVSAARAWRKLETHL